MMLVMTCLTHFSQKQQRKNGYLFLFLSSACVPLSFTLALQTRQLRRNARQRREYLYRKSLEGTQRELYEKKRKIRNALAGAVAVCELVHDCIYISFIFFFFFVCAFAARPEGKPIPSELRKEEQILRKQIQLDDELNDGASVVFARESTGARP